MKKTKLFATILTVACVVLAMGSYALVASAYDFGGIDLGGKTVTFVHFYNVFPESDLELLERKALAEEKFNCKIEMKTYSWGQPHVEGMMSRLLAGESEYDIWGMQSDWFWTMVGKGAFLSVGDVVPSEYYEDYPEIPTDFRGKRYQISFPEPSLGNMYVTLWNQDLFERENLPNPYDLYENGEWTYDAFVDIVKKATRDTDGDGQIDQWGAILWWDHAAVMAFSNNASAIKVTDDGTVVFAADSPEFLESLDLMLEVMAAQPGLNQSQGEIFNDGKAAMTIAGVYTATGLRAGKVGIVPLPMGPSATEYSYPDVTSGQGYFLPANSKEPLAMVAVYDFIFNQGHTEDEKEELIDETIMTYAKDRQSYQILREAYENWSGEGLWFRQMAADLATRTWGLVFGWFGDGSPAAAMTAIKPTIQSTLDDLFNK
jgi:multiple sugar transport system substrate-binding protein